MGHLYYENKNFAGGAFEKKIIKSVYFGKELLWPHIPLFITVDTSISKTITLENVNGLSIDWGDGNFGTGGSATTHTFSDIGIYEIKIEGMSVIPDAFLTSQTSVIKLFSKILFSSIGDNAFYYCSAITSFIADFSKITQIHDSNTGVFRNAFASGSHIELNFSSDAFIKLGVQAFYVSKVWKVHFSPNATFSVGGGAFSTCNELVEVTLGRITSLGDNAFYNCSAITSFTADFSQITQIPDSSSGVFRNAFASGSHIELNFSSDAFTKLGVQAFYVSKVWKVHFSPNATFSVGGGAFSACNELVEVTLGIVTIIDTNAFYNCIKLQTIRISNPNPPPINTVIPTNSLQKIYVPAASLSAYQNATGWIAYASYMEGF